MDSDEVVVDLRLRLDRKSGRVEVSILSENEQDAANVALSSLLRMHEAGKKPLGKVAIKSAKTDPNAKDGARLRPMWTKTTCDIIK
jgi:hypothetical protein